MAEVWTNWPGEQRCAPRSIERPASEEAVVAAVRRARSEGEALRVAGAGHSFTDIVCTDGYLLSLERMDRVLDADRESGLVRVQAGIRLHALGPRLAEHGLALENQGDIDAQALAGAISTGTHGTGIRFPNLSGQVAALRLVAGDGNVRELSPKSDPEGFLAARVGLGALGVITELTMRCVPLFTIRRVDEPRPLRELLASLEQHVEANDHFELFLLPYGEAALTLTSERSPDAEPRPRSPARAYLQDVVIENTALAALGRAARLAPALVPRLSRGFSRLISRSVHVDHSYRVYANRRNVRFTEMEYALPREHGREAIERVLDTVARRRLPIAFPIEMRFAPADDALLSTAHGRDTCYIAVHNFAGMEFETYFRAVEAIMDEYGGRPHWGKRHYQSAATLRPRYPGWDRFQAVRARLDPEGLFTNDYVGRVLGPVGGVDGFSGDSRAGGDRTTPTARHGG